MDLIISPVDSIKGELNIPPSKSYTQRALACSLLVEKLHINNIGHSEDEKAALSIIQACGVEIEWLNETQIITHNRFNFNTPIEIHCGESGLSARLFSVLLGLNEQSTKIIGEGTLLHRPMQPLSSIYEQLAVEYDWDGGKLPLTIQGKRTPKHLKVDGSLSSQFITGLLYYMVGLRHKETLILEIENIQSTPYINMTIETLNQIGASIVWQSESRIAVNPANLLKEAFITIESDWSSAAMWFVGAAISGDIKLKGLNPNSLQADRAILSVVEEFGASVEIKQEFISVRNNRNNGFRFDATHCPDLIPVLSVLAIFSKDESTIFGVNRLIHKESNRLECILNTLKSLNILYEHLDNFIKIKGNIKKNTSFQPIDIQQFDHCSDHRMVMAYCILASFLLPLYLKDFNVVAKSYPELSRDMVLLQTNTKVI